MANSSPFMNLNKSNMIPQPKRVLENNFPTFDNLLFTQPKNRPTELPLNEQKQFSLKMQILEEKLKNSESKRMMLESVNKNFILDEEKKIAEKLKERDNLNPNTLGLKAVDILRDIREEIMRKLDDDSFRHKETFSQVDNKIDEIKADITDKFNKLHHRQMMQIESFKYILEHSGSSRLRSMTKRVLGQEYYDAAQIKNKFIKPTEDELNEASKQVSQRSELKKNNSRRNQSFKGGQVLNTEQNLNDIPEDDDEETHTVK